jgi:uncharacterized protein (TIGR02145 family)
MILLQKVHHPYDWRVPQNDNLWQGVDGTNNPCPEGWRIPTQTEWATLVSDEVITNYTTAYQFQPEINRRR